MNRNKESIPFRVARDYIAEREAENFRDHKKGLPEWIKNSDDSYTRHEEKDGKDLENAKILLNLDKKQIICLDFGGANFQDIHEHLFFYGSSKAATQGKELTRKMVSGGHGNGGKYYALSQFKMCKIINYYQGKLSVFVITKKEDYVEIKNEEATPWEAIKEAGLNEWYYFEKQNKGLFDKLIKGELNFFCWAGIEPKDKGILLDKRKLQMLLSSVSNHPQSRSALRSRSLDALYCGKLLWPNIKPEEVEIDETFGIREFNLPNEIEGYKFNKVLNSVLSVKLSKKPLTGDKSSLNILEIDSFGKNVAYYSLPDFMLDKGLSKSLVARIDCPELKEYNCISNDRVNLIENEPSSLILSWCRSKIHEVLEELTNKEKKKEEEMNLDKLQEFINSITGEISELLEEDNLIKPKFSKLGKEKSVVDAPTDKPGFGKEGEIKEKGGGKRKGATEEKEESSENKKGKSHIQILLSNKQIGPDGKTYEMVERLPVLEQRYQDIPYGIWWLNTQKRYIRKLSIERNPELSKIFILFLTKEAILAHRTDRAFKEQERYDPDSLHTKNMELIDNIFSKVVDKLGIEISPDNNVAEKIRNAIKDKEKFTVAQISEETGADPLSIHAFISQIGNHVQESFNIVKERIEGQKGGPINVYVRK